MKTFKEVRKPVNTEKYDAYYAMVDAKKMAKKKGGHPDDYIDDLMKKRGYKKSSYSGKGVWKWVKEETVNEGQLEINFKNFARSEKKKLLNLLNSLKVKRKFKLKSVTSPMLDRSVTVKAYYLDLDDLRDYLKDKGYKWKDGKMWAGKPMDITMESLNEALDANDRVEIKKALKMGKTVIGKSKRKDGSNKGKDFKILKLFTQPIGIMRVKKAYVDWGQGKKPMDQSFISSYTISSKSTSDPIGMESVQERFREKVDKGTKLKDFEVFLGRSGKGLIDTDIQKALKILIDQLKKDKLDYNKKKMNLKSGAKGGKDVTINVIDEEDRYRLIVVGEEKSDKFKDIDLTASFEKIQKLSSAKFKSMWSEGTMRSGIFDTDVRKRKDAARKLVFFLKAKRNLRIGPMDDDTGSNKAIDSYIKELMKYVFDDEIIDDLYPTGRNANVKANDVVVKRLKKMGVKVK